MKRFYLAGAALLLAPIAQAADVNIRFSDEFRESLTEEYGVREGEYLTDLLKDDIARAFAEQMDQIGQINVVIEAAKPNRPTMKQMSDTIGLSFESYSLGGAALTGQVIGLNGETLANIEYDRYENDIRFVKGYSTWTDANRTFGRFARKLSDAAKTS